jgi:hypothetical protein
MSAADDVPLGVAWFENQGVKGEPAFGDPETLTWGNFTSILEWRREVEKDGPVLHSRTLHAGTGRPGPPGNAETPRPHCDRTRR